MRWRNEESLGRVKESVRVRRVSVWVEEGLGVGGGGSRCGWRRVSVWVEEGLGVGGGGSR